MQQLIRNLRGVSPVIGALMLTLITITAAASFAVFVSQKQEMIQEQQWAEQQRELEKLEIISINPNYENDKLVNLSFTVSSRSILDSTIKLIYVNDKPLYGNFTLKYTSLSLENWTVDNGSYHRYSVNSSTDTEWSDVSGQYYPLEVESYENIEFTIENVEENVSGLNTDYNNPLTIEIITAKTSSFEKTFYPPSAVTIIDVESLPATCTNYYILDGSLSDHPGDGYVVKWEWNVTNMSSPITHLYPEPFGRKAQVTNTSFIAQSNKYWVNLTVTDNFGMKGKTSFYYDIT